MYTVLIAEDELLVRMGLAASVLWEKLGMSVVGEAADGQQAYALFCELKPDILITDLSMPGMDGLTLIRKIRESGENCAVIVVTCLERFGALREAMDLGVVAYLLKVSMSVDDIERALLKAKATLGAPHGHSAQRSREELTRLALEEYCFAGLSSEAFADRVRRQGLEVLEAYYVCCTRLSSERPISGQLQRAFRDMLSERIRGQHVLAMLVGEGTIAALFTRTPKVHEMGDACARFAGYVSDNFGVRLLVGVTLEPVPTAALPACLEHMSDQLAQAEEAFVCFDAEGRRMMENVAEAFEHLRLALWQVADYAFASDAVRRTYPLEDAYTQENGAFSALLAELAERIFRFSGADPQQRLALQQALSRDAGHALRALSGFVREHLPVYRKDICSVIAMAVLHPQSALSLRQAAGMVALHPQYLSNLFKREVGVSYSDFVCTIRLLAAQRGLLRPGCNVRQIAEEMGFSDQAYFCRRFKQLTGKTPAQWKRSSLCGS